MKVLIIEDEKDIAIPLKRGLERVGFVVDYEATGDAGLATAELNQYDCILLDLNLPGMDGVEVCNALREGGNTAPVIMVTARSQQYDKLTGFDTGADDYVTKPFDFHELVARINALVRRNSLNKELKLIFGTYELSPDKLVVMNIKTEDETQLTNKESRLLEYLVRNQDRFVSAEELLEHVWDSEVDVFTETVKTHIKTLRQKLGKKVIETARGKGYKIAEI